MSVAETPPIMQPAQTNPQQQFALSSGVGALALLAGLALILSALPSWWALGWESLFVGNDDLLKNEFLSDALLILVELAVIGVLAFGAYHALQQHREPGLRAGIFFGAFFVFAALWIGVWIGGAMESEFDPTVGWVVIALVVAALLAGAGYLYMMVPGWQAFLEAVEHQGWFHANSYKGNQGVRVRRGTIIGILAVGVCGIITMVWHKNFGIELAATNESPRVPNDWYWVIPYASDAVTIGFVPIMYKVHMMLPIVFSIALLWFAWRVVNIPTFADFLIATEAEMNKVSWTSRKRLIQDTIVVLTTVFLFTMFLFVVDVIWIKILSAPGIKVLLIDPREAEKEQQETAKW